MLKQSFLVSIWLTLASVSLANSQPQNQYPPREERSEDAQADKSDGNAGKQATHILEIERDPTCAAKNSKENRNDGHIARLISKTIDDPLTILTGFLAVATFLLVLAVLCQLRDARKSSERQLRAYVFPTNAGLIKLNVGDVPEFYIWIKNTGQTPAYRLRHIAGVTYGQFPLGEPLPKVVFEGAEGLSKTNIGPGGELHKIALAKCPLLSEAIDHLQKGIAVIYAYGEFHFIDAFGSPRWVKYRFITGGNVGFRADGFLMNCEEGNETSDN